jgi:hypothetical protein
MSSIEVRPFRRGDREQLTALVNAHAAAVVPGLSVPVNTVMSQLEREPGEFIRREWVSLTPHLPARPHRFTQRTLAQESWVRPGDLLHRWS